MNRPYVICHMLATLDGKIIGDFLEDARAKIYMDDYEAIHELYQTKAWMIGRVSMEKHFTEGHKLDLSNQKITVTDRVDYISSNHADNFAIAIDPSGKLGWTKNYIGDDNHDSRGEHIIEVLTEKVSDAYLSYLQEIGISYIFGGKETLDFNVVLHKLKTLFSIDQLLLEGGGIVNGSFLIEDLVDEISLVLVPIVDGAMNATTMFESKKISNTYFSLKDVEKRDGDSLWLRYLRNNK